MKYRLLFGNHVDTHHEDRHLPAPQRREVRYTQGAVIETDEDLTRLNGRAGDARKFEMLSEDGSPASKSPFTWDRDRETLEQFGERMRAIGAVTLGGPILADPRTQAHTTPEVPPAATKVPVTNDIRKMSVEQLRTYAEAEEIDLKGAKDKDSVLKAILAAQSQLVGAK